MSEIKKVSNNESNTQKIAINIYVPHKCVIQHRFFFDYPNPITLVLNIFAKLLLYKVNVRNRLKLPTL